MELKPSEIYFSQDSVNNVFDKRCAHPYRPIGQTLDDLCEGRISTSSLPKIIVVKHNGKWTSGDNRRLWVFRQMERLGKCTTINVLVGYCIPLGKLTSYNGGVSVQVRGSPGGSWYLKRDASTSQTVTNSQQRYGLGPITQQTNEAVRSTNDIRTFSHEDTNLLERLRLSSAIGSKHTTVQAQKSPSSKKSVLDSKLMVAAIDFGTTNSGYAFSFRSDFAKDPMKIVTNQWTTSDGRSVPFKAPTCVLFDEFKRFNSFGFNAEDKYSRLVTENKQANWYFFKHFKMALYENKDLNKRTQIKDVKGKQMMATTVVSECIKYLMTSLLETCNQARDTIQPTDIHWVLTVPAIWNEGAKQFMREAAIEARIPSDSLTLALEPEAASMLCKHVQVEDSSDEEEESSGGPTFTHYALKPGSKYVILDAGGGTVDITVHNIQRDGKIKEIYKASGGPWGGTNVDEAFVQYLARIFGIGVIADFQGNHNGDYLDLMRDFELKKALINPDLHDDIKLKMPPSLYESYERVNGTEFSCSCSIQHVHQMKIVRDKIVVSSRQFVEMFSRTCDKIVTHLRELFRHSALQQVDIIVMVGGFSESRCLQREISRAFPNKNLVIPEDPGLAVVKGAVIYGHDPNAIVSRIARYTYGVKTASVFVEGVSKESKRFRFNGEDLCSDGFDSHVRIGQEVTVDEFLLARTYVPLQNYQPGIELPVYSSDKANPEYVDEIGCNLIGNVKVYFDNPYAPRNDNRVSIRFIYGDTELGIEARVLKTNQIVKASFDFLG